MSGVFVQFSVGAAGGAGGRTRYDTKERATERDHKRVWTQNVPEYVDRKEVEITGKASPGIEGKEVKTKEVSYKERRDNLIEFARQRDEDEQERSHEGSGETRTWYRAIYSFHEQATDEKAIEMVSEHQQENFPKCIIINSLHRNAEHLHVHSIIFARQTDDKKLQLGWKSYREIDESWARIYGREFGEHLAREHLEKKEERRNHRKEARRAKLEGREPPPRPERVSHKRNQLEERKKISLRELGVQIDGPQPTRTGTDQRPIAGAVERGAGATEGRAPSIARRRERPYPGGDGRTSAEFRGIGEAEAGTQRDLDGERAWEAERAPATRARSRARQRVARDGRAANRAEGPGDGDRARPVADRDGREGGGAALSEDSPVRGGEPGARLEGAVHGGLQTYAGGRDPYEQGAGAGGSVRAESPAAGERAQPGLSPGPGFTGQAAAPEHGGRYDGQPERTLGMLADAPGRDNLSGDGDLRSELDRQLDDATEPYRARLLEEERAKNTQNEQVITGMEHEGRLEHEPERVIEQVIEWTMDR